jgi:hypothetical protein
MAKRKKTKKKAAKAQVCSECGGGKRGRGYAHKATCSQASARGKGAAGGSGGFDGRSLRGMSVSELLALRGKVDELLESKAPEIDAEIQRLKDLRASIAPK